MGFTCQKEDKNQKTRRFLSIRIALWVSYNAASVFDMYIELLFCIIELVCVLVGLIIIIVTVSLTENLHVPWQWNAFY